MWAVAVLEISTEPQTHSLTTGLCTRAPAPRGHRLNGMRALATST
jgi:hypothetical protein